MTTAGTNEESVPEAQCTKNTVENVPTDVFEHKGLQRRIIREIVADEPLRKQTITLLGKQKSYYAWLPIVDVMITSGESHTSAVAVIDSGSTCSFAAKSVVNNLHLPIPKGDSWQIGIVGGGSVENSYGDVTLGLQLPNSSRQIVRKFRVLKQISGSLNRLKLTGGKGDKTWHYDSTATQIDILIGIDSLFEVYISAHPMLLRRIYEVRTVFGTTYAGSIAEKHRSIENALLALRGSEANVPQADKGSQLSNDELNKALEKFWNWEYVGIKESPDDELPAAQVAVDKAMQQAYFADGYYHVPLLFREKHPPLWNNLYVAKKRFESTENKYRKKPEVAKALKDAIQTWIDKGFASYVNESQIPQTYAFYGPISAVVKEFAYKSKVRPVADFSCGAPLKDHADKLARGEKLYPSLNSTLLECTVQYPSTAGMLMRQAQQKDLIQTRLIRYVPFRLT